jgi:cholera toxin transcriptional activator
MPASPNNSRIARFGVFEADLNAGELRKSGVKLRLQGQPFLVLALLLERAGEVVTREDLRQKLWPSDTFVDFDHSLNTAINKVREALGDSASSPRYVETLARRGYRFVAPVEIPQPISRANAIRDDVVSTTAAATAIPDKSAVTPPAASPSISDRPVRAELAAASTGRQSVHPELDVPIPHRGLTRGLFVLSQVMYLIFYFVALRRLHAVQDIADSFLSPGGATALVVILMVTAGVGIPLRCYLISAAGFDHQRLGEKFRQIFPFVLILDELWAVAPFLLIQKIGLGAAFAVCAALLYLPFSERTLIRMAYLRSATSSPP